MRISSKERRLILYVIISSCIFDLIDLIVQWNHSSCHHHHSRKWCSLNSSSHQNNQLSQRLSIFGGVSGLILNYDLGNPSVSVDDQVRPSPHHSSSDSWVSEELWPKEKSIIHIKLIKPVPKELTIRESRNKDTYLLDPSLDFDSPYRLIFINNCTLSFKSYYDGFTSEPNNQEITRDTSNIQVQITGGIDCKELPLSPLTAFSANLTHLVVRNTGITKLTKFLFGANRLDKLIRLDIIDNHLLTNLQPRAFDGLTKLSYLSLINNSNLTIIALESFAGLKSLEELIFLGNGQFWDQNYFTTILRSASDKILPNLIHLHLHGAQLTKNQYENQIKSEYSFSTIDHQSDENNNPTNYRYSSKLRSSSIESSISSHQSPEVNGMKVNYDRGKSGLKINKDDFNGLTQVKYLQLSDCDITYIHPLALAPLLRNIISLNLAGNPKLRIDNLKSILAPFYVSNVKKLNLESEQLTVNSSFQNYPISNSQSKIGLVSLDLSHSIDTSYVPKDLLTIISKTTITELYMDSVPWRSLREGDIPPMPHLKVLHIDNNQIETIDEKTFDGLEDLIRLSLRGNLIQEIPLYLLEPLRKLEYLDLSGYQVKLSVISNNQNDDDDHHHADSNNGDDDNDDGGGGDNDNDNERKSQTNQPDNLINQYTPLNIPRKFFVGTSLKELNLSYKNLTQLTRFQFIGLYKLERLHLRGCNLQNIEYLTFFPLKSIVYIDLSENNQLIGNVRSSEEDTFAGLEAIEMIRLANCNLTTEDINDFNIWRRMHEHVQLLDLSSNLIDLINSTTLANFTELRHINLSHNQIKSWHNYTIFGKNSFITTLDISFNQITHLTAEMLGDFRNLKNLSFAFNPLNCECDWDGPLLLLDQKQKKLNQVHHAKIQDHIQQLVDRQQEIVSTAFASSQAPPKSIIEWLNTTSIHFLLDHHPLRSDRHYFCHQSKSPLEPPIVFKKFFYQDCPVLTSSRSNSRVSVGILMVTVCTALLLAVFLLVIAFIYNTTIRNLLTMVDDDFLHNYQYDAFVSYNVNDSDWVFNILVPALEDLPADEHCEGQSTIKFNNNNNQSSTELTNQQHSSSGKSHVKLCVYDRDFIAGRPISECITESIRNSRKVILIISNNFAQSPWCRFETDLAHNTLMDQNREGLILIKLEEMSSEVLEKVAPQLHFLLKTRIYLTWSESLHEQEIFWKKLRRALGFTKPYGTVKQYYKNYVGGLTKDRRQSIGHLNNSIPTSVNNNSNNNYGKDEVHVSFTRKTLSSSRESLPSNDSGIITIDDSGCVSVNGDDSVDNVTEFIVDQKEILEESNQQNNLDQETGRKSNERKVTSVAIQLLNVIGNNSEEDETIGKDGDEEEDENDQLKEEQFISLEMDDNHHHVDH